MAKITEYPVVTEIQDDDVLLVDGELGTRGLSVSGFADAVAENIVESTAITGLVADIKSEIEDKGEEVIESIPQDYTELSSEVDDLKSNLMALSNTQIIPHTYTLESGGINSSGEEIIGNTYMRFADYVPTSEASNIVFVDKGISSNYALNACYYNSEKVFQTRVVTSAGYNIDTDYAYVRLTFYNANGANEELFRSWISWIDSDVIDVRFKALEEKGATYITAQVQSEQAQGIQYIIEMGKAKYDFRRVQNQSLNLLTYRLYKGEIISGSNSLVMWENSDAEGVIRLVGEEDYIGGFHGDEVYQSITFLLDGNVIDASQAFSRREFKTFDAFVYSRLYNAGTSATESNTAFLRYKHLHFEGNKVTISNRFTAAKDVLVQQAPLMLFQCNKNDASNNLCFTNYTVDSDYNIYSTSDAASYPEVSTIGKCADLLTKLGAIHVEVEQIDPTYAEEYRCVISASFLTSQNRLKIYFNTIRDKVAGTALSNGNSILARFAFSVS